MRDGLKIMIWNWTLVLAMLLCSCKDTFDHSVYSSEVPSEYRDLRANNFRKLENVMPDPEDTTSYKIALISDSHTTYDDLQDAVNAINMDQDIKFVLHGGDVTDGGILQEFLLFQSIMNQLSKPYFTVVGNHDCLANGLDIYEEMFGPEYYSFVTGNCKFIFFNDVFWELQFREPNYFWLREELANNGNYSHLFVVAHIAPFSDSFTPLNQEVYTTIMDTSNVSISIHGHHHDHGYSEHYEDDVMYLIIGAVAKRYYVTLTISPDTVVMERQRF